MEKCPKCGKWLLAFFQFRKELRCYNKECNYVKKLTKEEVEKWLDDHDVLPKLAESLRLREKK